MLGFILKEETGFGDENGQPACVEGEIADAIEWLLVLDYTMELPGSRPVLYIQKDQTIIGYRRLLKTITLLCERIYGEGQETVIRDKFLEKHRTHDA